MSVPFHLVNLPPVLIGEEGPECVVPLGCGVHVPAPSLDPKPKTSEQDSGGEETGVCAVDSRCSYPCVWERDWASGAGAFLAVIVGSCLVLLRVPEVLAALSMVCALGAVVCLFLGSVLHPDR